MEKVEVATATKGSVELLNLSAKSQEKDLAQYTQYEYWNNIHTLYNV